MEHFQITETELWEYISKTASPKTIEKVERWINSSDYDEGLLKELTTIYDATSVPELAIEKAENRFFETVDVPKNTKKKPFYNLLKYAAILVFILSGTFVYYKMTSNNDVLVIQTIYGEQKQIALSDGSTVWLNASSRLSYDKEFPRTLYLEGEAFFDVAKDTVHPFTVSTADDLQVRALGTSFNVKSYLNSTTTETKLFTGKVAVKPNKVLKNSVILNPNEQVIFDRAKKEMVKTTLDDNETVIAWKEGKIQFKNKIFKEIAQDLKNQFNIHIVFENEQIAAARFTGSFPNTTPVGEILEILKISKDFNYELNTETNAWIIT